MKFVNYREGASLHAGALIDDVVYPLHGGIELSRLIAEGTDLARLAEGAEQDPVSDPELGPALATPPSFRDFMSFEAHISNALGGNVWDVWYQQPSFYFSNTADLLGPRDDVEIFPGSDAFDFELEVGAVVGRAGTNLTVEEAAEAIIGYVLLCDWSARDLQLAERVTLLGPAKGKDGATTVGPVFVTADEFAGSRSGHGFDLPLSAKVNGTDYTDGNLKDLYWSFEQMVAYASRGTHLRPGDLIGSGTVGWGCIGERHLVDPLPWLVPGDVVSLQGGPLGEIRARVVPSSPVHPLGLPGQRLGA